MLLPLQWRRLLVLLLLLLLRCICIWLSQQLLWVLVVLLLAQVQLLLHPIDACLFPFLWQQGGQKVWICAAAHSACSSACR
jgi:hypothetical protein